MDRSPVVRTLFALMLCLLIGGCAGSRAFERGEELMLQRQYDRAVLEFSQALEHRPERHEYRARLLAAQSLAAQGHLKQGRLFQSAGELGKAAAEYRIAAELDPTLHVVEQELKRVRELMRIEELLAEAEEFFRARRLPQAKGNLEQVLQLDPGSARALALLKKVKQSGRTLVDGFELDVKSTEPITLQFKEADLRDVFNILSKLSGINFIFDEDIRSQSITLMLEDATFAQALELLLKMNNLGKKVLNPRTIIIYPKTKEKEKLFEDQVIQTFYLSNIDAKKAVNMLRTMLQLRKVYVHEELNALVIRENPQVIELAQQILEAADRADSEVVFDLELVEVSHGDDLNLGPRLSTYSVSAGYAKKGGSAIVANTLSSGTETANLVDSLSGLESFYTLPSATFDFAKTLTDSEVLANPKIRVKNKEKAKVHIGTREPVITVTINGDNRSDNIQYVDVGVKLDVEPTIQLDDTVVTKLGLEVSSVSDPQTTDNGSVALTITTTNAQTALTLKDGEQTIIGGLIRDDYSKNRSSIALIGDIPLIGDLLSSHNRNKQKREILLSITPHIVKSVDLPRADVASIWSGGEEDLKAGPAFGAFAEGFEPVTEGEPKSVAPALQAAPALPEAAAEPVSVPPVSQPPAETRPEAQEAPPAPTAEEAAEQAAAAGEQVEMVELPPLEIPEVQRQARVYLAGPTLVEAGEQFAVDVMVAEVQDLYSAPLFVTYDAGHLQFSRAEEGGFLKQEGSRTIFTTSADREQGRLIIGYKQGAGGTGVTGSGNLFRLFFEGENPGRATIALERINFRDPEGNRLSVEPEEIVVEVR